MLSRSPQDYFNHHLNQIEDNLFLLLNKYLKTIPRTSTDCLFNNNNKKYIHCIYSIYIYINTDLHLHQADSIKPDFVQNNLNNLRDRDDPYNSLGSLVNLKYSPFSGLRSMYTMRFQHSIAMYVV